MTHSDDTYRETTRTDPAEISPAWYRLLPEFLGYASESLSREYSGHAAFERLVRQQPPVLRLWETLLTLLLDILDSETEVLEEEPGTLNCRDARLEEWRKFTPTRCHLCRVAPHIPEAWLQRHDGYIKHPDRHSPEEGIEADVATLFARRFGEWDWGTRWAPKVIASLGAWVRPGYWAAFQNRHVVLPVIHVETKDQTLHNADIAREAGCDGLFLINHGLPYQRLLEIHHAVCEEFPDWWVGVNCLDLHPKEVFRIVPSEVAGVWVDNAMIDERQEHQPEAERLLSSREQSGWQGLYFGGVAFKYQRPVEDLARAARLATQYMDVVTTSGPGTGQAAHRDKIVAMKSLGRFPLAIASGITPENVRDYLGSADCFLVATGISKNFTELDPTRVRGLMHVIRSYQPA